MKRSILAILMLALALLAAGCGDDDDGDGGDGGADPQEAVADSTRAYLTAAAEGDGAGACSQITEGAQEALETAAATKGAEPTCEELLSQGSAQGADLLQPLIDAIDAEDVTVDGDSAEITIEGTEVPLILENVDGQWLVSETSVRESYQLGGA